MSKHYQIEPDGHREVRIRTSDGTVFPVGVPFEYDGKIDELRKLLPEGRTVETVSGEAAGETPSPVVEPGKAENPTSNQGATASGKGD